MHGPHRLASGLQGLEWQQQQQQLQQQQRSIWRAGSGGPHVPLCCLPPCCRRLASNRSQKARNKNARALKELSWPKRLDMLRDVAAGMHYLHTRRPPVIHGDLRSPNLLLDLTIDRERPRFHVKIADFGLARCGRRRQRLREARSSGLRTLAPLPVIPASCACDGSPSTARPRRMPSSAGLLCGLPRAPGGKGNPGSIGPLAVRLQDDGARHQPHHGEQDDQPALDGARGDQAQPDRARRRR